MRVLSSSRPFKAGSIAARTRSMPDWGCPTLPAHSRRAPLRHLLDFAEQLGPLALFPPIQGGLHCGPQVRFRWSLFSSLFPPIQGGLHCGFAQLAGEPIAAEALPAHSRRAPLRPRCPAGVAGRAGALPAHSRRAPLRPVPLGHPQARDRALPAHSRRAPLRLGISRMPLFLRAVSSRPFKAGSIAASWPPRRSIGSTSSSRPFKAGSIAAGRTGPGYRRRRPPLPAHSRRAPLRLTICIKLSTCYLSSSRPFKAGSIAAPGRPGRRRRARRSSRPFKAGSIAAFRSLPVPVMRLSSSRPFKAGSIAATGDRPPSPLRAALFPPIQGGLHCGSAS